MSEILEDTDANHGQDETTADKDGNEESAPSVSDIPGPWSKLGVTRNARVVCIGGT